MKKIHVLNGDCLYKQLKDTSVKGDFIICRECLIEGDLSGDTITDFMKNRSKYLSQTYKISESEYFKKTQPEFEKILNIPVNSDIYLWFENDLFCQTNLWFIFSLLADNKNIKNVFRIFPVEKDKCDQWKGFGNSDSSMLRQAFYEKIKLSEPEIKFGKDLWTAYKESDINKLIELSNESEYENSFKYLKEVCEANAVKYSTDNLPGRPEKVIRDIIENKTTDFISLFSEFSEREGIYGYGDIQVKRIYDEVMNYPDLKKGKKNDF